MVNKYLSHGGGVNSVALMVLLRNEGIDFEAVYADVGGDHPETLEYLRYLNNLGFPVTVLPTKVEGLDLYDYCLKYKIIPVRWQRWCTWKFKIKPLRDCFKRPCVVFLAIDSSESHRAGEFIQDGMVYEYPLVERGIDRNGCIEIIRSAGLKMPRKSGCIFCPFARVSHYRELRDNYPELWCRVKRLEDTANARLLAYGREPMFLLHKPLEKIVNEQQSDLFGFRKPCNCEIE